MEGILTPWFGLRLTPFRIGVEAPGQLTLVFRFAFSFTYQGGIPPGNRPVVHSAILAERPATLVIILMTRLMTRPLLSALKFGA